MQAELALDEDLGARPVHLPTAPLLGTLAERDLAGARVDVLTGNDGGCRLIEPALRIGLAEEVLSVFLAGRVPVARAPLAIWPLLNARHQTPISARLRAR
jgi:hypothetical protein